MEDISMLSIIDSVGDERINIPASKAFLHSYSSPSQLTAKYCHNEVLCSSRLFKK
jgi:hypothetical protein